MQTPNSLNQKIFKSKEYFKNISQDLENIKWFRYWEIPSKNWPDFFEETEKKQFIFVPIHWGYHFRQEHNIYDFDSNQDFNLGYIERLATEYEREILFFVPIGPYPFDSRGGVPQHLFNQSVDLNSIPRIVTNSKGDLCRIPSFYNPQMYKEYARFLVALHESCKNRKSKVRIKGLSAGYFEDKNFQTFFNDSSKTFLESFERYISANDIDEVSLNDVYDFREMVSNLFLETSEKYLGAYWDGDLKMVFHGAKSDDILFSTIFDSIDEHYFYDLQLAVKDGYLTSTEMINGSEQAEVFTRAYSEMMNYSYVESKVFDDFHLQKNLRFSPLIFAKIFSRDKFDLISTGILDYFEKNCSHHYQIIDGVYSEDLEEEDESISICFSRYLGNNEFKNILNNFAQGSNIILDLSCMTLDHRKQLELFLSSHETDSQHINLIGPVSYYQLGNGNLVTFESEHFQGSNTTKRNHFWARLLSVFSLRTLKIDLPFGVSCFVLKREVTPYELNYKEVRRIFLYNMTNSQKSVFIHSSKESAFLKYKNQLQTEVISKPQGVEIDLGKNGSVILDFGIIKDNHEKRTHRTI